jgi:hypothetical protein
MDISDDAHVLPSATLVQLFLFSYIVISFLSTQLVIYFALVLNLAILSSFIPILGPLFFRLACWLPLPQECVHLPLRYVT